MNDKNMNNQKDLSEKLDEMFDQNKTANDEMMNRDYLNHIFDDDMDSLNKYVLLTRTQHLKRVDDTNKSYEKKITQAKKLLIISIIILAIFIGIAISFYSQAITYYNTFLAEIWNMGSSSGYTDTELVYIWRIFGLSLLFGSVSLMIGGLQFFFVGVGKIKQIKDLKKSCERAIQNLEDIKKENMLAGTYDASK